MQLRLAAGARGGWRMPRPRPGTSRRRRERHRAAPSSRSRSTRDPRFRRRPSAALTACRCGRPNIEHSSSFPSSVGPPRSRASRATAAASPPPALPPAAVDPVEHGHRRGAVDGSADEQ
jgi:hypothetical protein